MNNPMRIFLVFLLIGIVVSQAVTTPIEAIGTVLPRFAPSSVNNFRAFNDLMKQSLPLVPYQLASWGGIGRCWSCNLTFIDGLSHRYPASLPQFTWAVAEIPFLAKNDDELANQTFNLAFSGKGVVGVFQDKQFNTTWNSSTATGGQFTLKLTNQSLFVYIYNTDPTDPVKGITILPTALGNNPPTFTEKFLNSLKPFNLLRTCFWQGQSLYNSGQTSQIWKNRTLVESSTQITLNGVALEHILELETATGATLWPCIPDSADNDYITRMASLIGSTRDKTKIMYLEFGNIYHIMNDFPDAKTNPAFTTFMATYGSENRNKVLFVISYKDIQYYLNAMGMRTTPVNFTYIDAIGFQANFGTLEIAQVLNASIDQIKSNLTHNMLSAELFYNRAYQISRRNGTHLVGFSGGPYIKTYQYGYIWKNSSNSSYSANATLERTLANTLYNMNMNDPWVGEFYLQWLARMKGIGIKSVMFSQLVGGGFTLNTDIVPLLQFLNATTIAYNAIYDYVFNGRVTTLPIAGNVPANPFVCNPACVWGDCINNVCVCYAGYSGANCSVYTVPQGQDKIGVNLQGISYWSSQNPFVDMHRSGSAWVFFIINGGWSSGDAYKSQVTFDNDGYPTYLPPGISVGTLIARDLQTHYDAGNYTILYDGQGILNFGLDVKKAYYSIGKVIITVTPTTDMNNGILIQIDRTNPSNYIRNIRVIRPGYENTWWTQKFSPLLLEKLAPFKTLRFMDWTNTNAQTDAEWSDRVLTTDRTYTANGVAWEEVIHLANILGKDVWVNIPHLASDEYITELAKLFLDKLEPHLKVHVEYSNEVWGTLFPGGKYAQDKGVQYYLGNITDPTQARFCYLALTTKRIASLWRAVWNTTENRSRLKIAVATQAVNADTTKRILQCESLYTVVDQVAIAPYIDVPLTDSMTKQTLFTNLNTQVGNLSNMIKTHLTWTNQYNLSLTNYESGQGLLGNTAKTTQFSIDVQTDDRMRALYVKYFEMLFNNSIKLTNLYTESGPYTRYGSWGTFQYVDEKMTYSAKWNGTVEYIANQNLTLAQWTFGKCNLTCSGNGVCSFGRCICYADFSGPDCSVSKYTDYFDCGYLCTFNQGVCLLNSTIGNNKYYTCTCNSGYIGVHCGIPLCTGNCNFAGTCISAEKCQCLRGRMGDKCQTDCGCQGHGTCKTDGTCQCDDGFVFNATSRKCEFACFGNASANCYGPNLLGCANGCVSGTCQNGTCKCWPGFSGTDCSTQVTVTYLNDNLGINVGGLSYYSTQHLLKDYFKQSSQWIPQYYPGFFNGSIAYTWNTSEPFPTQLNGHPSSLALNQSVAKLLLRDLNLKYPSINQTNDYVLLYDGDGILSLGFDASVYENSAGRIRFRVTPSTVRDNGVIVKLLKTNPANPLRNVRVVLARDQYNFDKDLLTENFVNFISQFSTIRFMDLSHTNGSPVKEWNDSTRADQDSQASANGISPDLLTKIITRTGRNAWVNIPHLASDDYVQKLASHLKANIPTKRTIFVQYSNEVWNQFFAQGKYAVEQATKLGLANYHKFYAQRSLQIFNIFSSVFGAGSPRVKFVISFQAVSKWVADQILVGTGLTGVVNVVAGAPYYDCDNIGNNTNTAFYATLKPQDVINKCQNSFSKLDQILAIQNTVAQTYNLPMAAYEAGTSISQQQTIYSGSQNPGATANFIAANQAPGMYDVYKNLLYAYKRNNFTKTAPLMLFSSIGLPSKYGSWGLLDYMDQIAENQTHPKFKAIVDFNIEQCLSNQTNCQKCSLPFSLIADINGNCYRCKQDICRVCDSVNPSICQKCAAGNSPVNGVCKPCPQNCGDCNAATNQCLTCKERFVLNATSKKCLPCVPGCLQCSIDSLQTCTTCQKGTYLDQNKVCKLCSTNCLQCTNSTSCTVARDGMVIIGVTVIKCRPGCRKCDTTDPELCSQCQEGFTLSGTKCVQCTQSGCATCSNTSLNVCTSCIQNRILQDGSCLQCDRNCQECTSPTSCTTCVRGFILNGTTCVNATTVCSIGCIKCSLTGDTTKCTECDFGFLLTTAGKCVKCVSSCGASCDPNNPLVCTSCMPGFENANGTCVKCPANCQTCAQGVCTFCTPGFKLVQNSTGGYSCERQCILPCISCTNGVCLQCSTNYTLTDGFCQPDVTCGGLGCEFCPTGSFKVSQGVCGKCQQNCGSCVNETSCLACREGFYLNSSACVACPEGSATCVDSTKSILCKPGYVMQAVSITTADLTSASFSHTCIPCQSPCKQCMILSDLCVSCINDDYRINGTSCLKKIVVGVEVKLDYDFVMFLEEGQLQQILNKLSSTVNANFIVTYIRSGSTVTGLAAQPTGNTVASDLANSVSDSINSGTLGLPVLSSSVGVFIEDQAYSSGSSESVNKLALILGIVIGSVGFIVLIGTAIYCLKRSRKIQVAEVKPISADEFSMKENASNVLYPQMSSNTAETNNVVYYNPTVHEMSTVTQNKKRSSKIIPA